MNHYLHYSSVKIIQMNRNFYYLSSNKALMNLYLFQSYHNVFHRSWYHGTNLTDDV